MGSDLRTETRPDPGLSAILLVLRRHWQFPTVGVVLGLATALVILHAVRPRFDAYLQIVPVERSGETVSRNLAGLASLAGINIRNEPISQFHLTLEILAGRDVAAEIAANKALMRRMFADEWDDRAQVWRPRPDAFRSLKKAAKALLAIPVREWSPPDDADVQDYLDRRLTLEENKQRGVATIILRDPDPDLARDLLVATYAAADRHLRQRADARAEAYIGYLAKKLSEVTLAEHRAALAEALAEQERLLMMARSGQPFAAEPLGAVTVTDRPTWPPVLLVLAAGLVAGGLAGASAALLLDQARRPLPNEREP